MKWVKDTDGYWKAVGNPPTGCLLCGKTISRSTRYRGRQVCQECLNSVLEKAKSYDHKRELFIVK